MAPSDIPDPGPAFAAPLFVLTCDQRASRRSPDAVPAALRALDDATRTGAAPVLGAERTAGDEIQTVYDDATSTVTAVEVLTRLGGWRIGIGLGDAERPLPDSTREARGEAFVAARDAVERARNLPGLIALRSAHEPSAERVVGDGDHGRLRPVDAAEYALALLVTTLTRRTNAGWEIVDLVDSGLNGRQAAAHLGISESAVSQRLARAAHDEGLRARALSVFLLDRAVQA